MMLLAALALTVADLPSLPWDCDVKQLEGTLVTNLRKSWEASAALHEKVTASAVPFLPLTQGRLLISDDGSCLTDLRRTIRIGDLRAGTWNAKPGGGEHIMMSMSGDVVTTSQAAKLKVNVASTDWAPLCALSAKRLLIYVSGNIAHHARFLSIVDLNRRGSKPNETTIVPGAYGAPLTAWRSGRDSTSVLFRRGIARLSDDGTLSAIHPLNLPEARLEQPGLRLRDIAPAAVDARGPSMCYGLTEHGKAKCLEWTSKKKVLRRFAPPSGAEAAPFLFYWRGRLLSSGPLQQAPLASQLFVASPDRSSWKKVADVSLISMSNNGNQWLLYRSRDRSFWTATMK
jgi:hypothetical protein